ncbi:NAD-dependent epimerase/dehydratase family protein [Saccharopolyspora hirsuta]|uniref:NAD-dependent epimerase/dehydratase family protein n=1 Tax=Saccharopolyspora hirsuta TaxID=1837 RepID=UPI003325473D
MTSDLHVVLGAGPAGTTTVDELLTRGLRVRHVNRSPIRNAPAGVEVVQADVANPGQAIAATEGAATIYHAVNVPYHQQLDLMPGIANSVLAAATHHEARLVVLDTLYPYGEADGEAITENTPWAATSRKGRMRAALDKTYLEAHRAGETQVVLGRSADFYGPRVLLSTLGATFFPAALAGEPALAFGDITLPHSYTYLPDAARALVDLGTATEEATGRAWHLPTVPATSTKQIHELVEHLTGKPLTTKVLQGPTPTGPFDAQFMNEYAELFYQHEIPQNMVSKNFETHFNRHPTPLKEGLQTTLTWYKTHLRNQ